MDGGPLYHGRARRASPPSPSEGGLGDDRRPSPGGRRPASAAPWPASEDHYGAGGLPGSPRLPRESRAHKLDGSSATFHTGMTKGENMSTLARITLDQVEAAYEATGYKPDTDVFIDDLGNLACPIGVVALAQAITTWATTNGRGGLGYLAATDFARYLHLDEH